jgi:hypothetical protein
LAVNKSISAAEAARLTYILREVRCSLEAIPPEPKAETVTSLNIVSIDQDHFIRDSAMTKPNLLIEHIPSAPKSSPIEAINDVEIFIPTEEQPPIKIVEPEPAPMTTIDAPPTRPMMQKPGGGWVPVPPRSSLRPPPRKTVW